MWHAARSENPPPRRMIRRTAYFVACGAAMLVLEAGAAGTGTAPVAETTARLSLGRHLQYLEDPGADKTLPQVLATLGDPSWDTVTADIPNFGYTDSAYWFTVDLEPLQGAAERNWLLEIAYALPDDIDLYLLSPEGEVERHVATGDGKPFAARPLEHHHFVFPIELTEDRRQRLLLRVDSSGTIQVPLNLWESGAFQRADQSRLLGQGLYFGIMLVMVLYNFFLYLTIRDTSYLYYVLFVGNFALFQAALQGFAYQYFWPDAVWWQGQAVAVLASAAVMFACLFSRRFLALPQTSGWMNRFLVTVTAAAGGTTVFAVFGPYSVSIRMTVVLAIVMSVGVLACGIVMWSRGSKPARYFTIAWLIYLLGVLMIGLNKFAWLPRNIITEYAMQLGSALEVILLSFALADRINQERADKLTAQQAALENERLARLAHEEKLQTQRQATEMLESRVQERTRKLESTLDELGRANRMLERLNRMDGLTGIHNRRSFDESLDKEFRRARREGRPLSLIIFDLDHFKDINDRYGHLVGDDCLKTVARHLLELLRRPSDLAARYGGEEFAVIAGKTDTEGARYLAEALRRRIEGETIEAGGGEDVTLTLSGGVATLVPDGDDQPQDLIAAADAALYCAKHAGRNRICAQDPSREPLLTSSATP